jgi:glycine hydroxymethyltransferase
VTGKQMEKRLDKVNITVNKNAIPNDPESPFTTSGIRVGSPAVTARGMKEDDMRIIAGLIYLAATEYPQKADYIRSEVAKLCDKYPLYN